MGDFGNPLAALQQQGFAPPDEQQQQAAPPPQGPPIAATSSGQPIPPQSGRPGTLKSMLFNFMQGAGESMIHESGGKTPWEKQQEQIAVQQRQQQIDQAGEQVKSLAAYRQLQEMIQRQQNEQQPITPEDAKQNPLLAPVVGQLYSPKQKADLVKGLLTEQLKNQGKENVQGMKNQAPGRASAAARDDRFISLSGVDPNTWSQDDKNFMKGYAKYVDVNKVQPGLERAKIFAAPRWASLDPALQGRISLARNVAAGKYGDQLNSFDAFVGHLGDFHDSVKELGNMDANFLNRPLNELSRQFGNAKMQEVIAKIEPVRKEFESLLLNNRALYDADRKSADVILSTSSSPAQIEVAVKSLAKTASIRLGAVNSSVRRVTGMDIPEIIQPSHGAILQELGADIPGYGDEGNTYQQTFGSPKAPNTRPASRSAAPAAKSQGAPTIGTVSKGYRFKGGNPADKNNWEKQ